MKRVPPKKKQISEPPTDTPENPAPNAETSWSSQDPDIDTGISAVRVSVSDSKHMHTVSLSEMNDILPPGTYFVENNPVLVAGRTLTFMAFGQWLTGFFLMGGRMLHFIDETSNGDPGPVRVKSVKRVIRVWWDDNAVECVYKYSSLSGSTRFDHRMVLAAMIAKLIDIAGYRADFPDAVPSTGMQPAQIPIPSAPSTSPIPPIPPMHTSPPFVHVPTNQYQ